MIVVEEDAKVAPPSTDTVTVVEPAALSPAGMVHCIWVGDTKVALEVWAVDAESVKRHKMEPESTKLKPSRVIRDPDPSSWEVKVVEGVAVEMMGSAVYEKVEPEVV